MKQEKYTDFYPEIILRKLYDRMFPGEQRKTLKVCVITSIAVAFMCYFMLMVTGYSGPDSNSEGVLMYHSFGWALSIGRWFIAYAETYAVGSAVIPFLIVMMYSLLVGFSALILFRVFDIRQTVCHILITAIFVSFPVVEMQFGYLYMAVYYAFSFFCVVAGTMLIRTRKIAGYIAAFILFTFMLGSYQSYIGGVAALAVMLFAYDMINNRKIGASFADLGATAGVGIISAVADLLIVNITMKRAGIEASSRVSGFSLSSILDNFGFSFEYSFKWFLWYFKDELFSRDKIYLVLFALLMILVVLIFVKMIMERHYAGAVLMLAAVLLIPFAMNTILFLFPSNGVTTIMKYHYVLIFVFGIALIDKCSFNLYKCGAKWISYLLLFVLLNTYILSANIGGLVYKAAYTETYTEAMAMVNRIYAVEGFEKKQDQGCSCFGN